MNVKMFTFVWLILLSSDLTAQIQGWQLQPSGTTTTLTGVAVLDANMSVAVGFGGTILKTTNAGAVWVNVHSVSTDHFNSVRFSEISTGIAVGYDGVIVRTTDGGDTWVRNSSGTLNDLLGVSLTGPLTGTAVGTAGTILRTTDGGLTTWTTQTSGTTDNLYAVSFTSDLVGYAVGGFTSGIILKTTNGGATWVRQTSGTSNILTAVCAANADVATAVGLNGTILRTTNGGVQWTTWTGEFVGALSGTHFTNVDTGFVVGVNGILNTIDGGATWIMQPSGTNVPLKAISFIGARIGAAVGESGAILRTETGGWFGWRSQYSGTLQNLNGVSAQSAHEAVVVGDSGIILRTTNDGQQWMREQCSTANNLRGVSFPSSLVGFVAGDSGIVLRTSDGGHSWSPLVSGVFESLKGIFFIDDSNGWTVGTEHILHTSDGGLSWAIQDTNGRNNSIHFYDRQRGIVVKGNGINGVIRWTTDAGSTWPLCNPMSFPSLNGVQMLAASVAVAVGRNYMSAYTIFRTTNGGVSWAPVGGTGLSSLYGVSFANPLVGTAVGTRIYRTTDGGLMWNQQDIGYPGASFLSVSCPTPDDGYAVGNYGAIYHTSTGGALTRVVQPELAKPIAVLLEQNYPNPFNPSTTIQLTLPHSGFAKLVVYDILGREIATLLAAELPAGVHTVHWDASNRPSGIYFYRLESGLFVETKKLILLR